MSDLRAIVISACCVRPTTAIIKREAGIITAASIFDGAPVCLPLRFRHGAHMASPLVSVSYGADRVPPRRLAADFLSRPAWPGTKAALMGYDDGISTIRLRMPLIFATIVRARFAFGSDGNGAVIPSMPVDFNKYRRFCSRFNCDMRRPYFRVKQSRQKSTYHAASELHLVFNARH